MRTSAALGALVAAALLVLGGAACTDDDSPKRDAGKAPNPSGEATVRFESAALSADQAEALRQVASRQMAGGRIPEDVAMVADPQPEGLPASTKLIAVSYGECGNSRVDKARLDGSVLVVEVVQPPQVPGSFCAGTLLMTGLRVTVPSGASITAVKLERRTA